MNPARVGIAEGSAFYEVARRGGTLRLYDLSQTSEGHKASIEFYTQDVIQVPWATWRYKSAATARALFFERKP